MCLIAVGFKGSGPSKVYAKKKKNQRKIRAWFLFPFYQAFVFTFETVCWDRSRARQAYWRSSNIWHFSQTFYSGLSQRCRSEEVCHSLSLSSQPDCCDCTHNMAGWGDWSTITTIVNHWIVVYMSFSSYFLKIQPHYISCLFMMIL